MRILILSYEFPPLGGGGAKVVYGLSKELAMRGHEVDIVTMGFRGLPGRETVNGVNVHRVPCIRSRTNVCTSFEMFTYLVMAVPKVLRLIGERRYDLNHTHFVFPDGVISRIAKWRTGLSYLITAHGSDIPGYNPNRFRWEHRLLSPLWGWVVRGASRIACPSDFLKSLILKQDSELQADVIPNGIDLGRFDPSKPKEKRILAVTRMFERKGVQYLLRSLEGMQLDHEVQIVGDGPYLETLRALADELKVKVTFRGQLDNKSRELTGLYETSNIFVLASETENFPIVLLEAMASGAAIVTTRGTGCAEVVGDTGLLVEPRDPEGLRSAVLRLAKDPALCRRLGETARKRLESRFGWSAVADQYLELYKNLQ